MPTGRRALLLLPSRRGLVEYDVLEDYVYLGPADGGGVRAAPAPFGKATVVLAATEGGYVARALPGEAPPTVDGAPATDLPLAEEARLAIAGETVLFRSEAARPPAAGAGPTPPPPAPGGPSVGGGTAGRAGGRARRAAAPAGHPLATAALLVGAVLLLAGIARAVHHLAALRDAEAVRVDVPDPPAPPAPPDERPERSARAFEALLAWEEEHPDDVDAILERYREFLLRHAGTPDADRARARIREVVDEAGRRALARLEADLPGLLEAGSFRAALAALRDFERTYGATPSQEAIPALRRRVREAAREARDRLLAEVAPLVTTDPRAAHRRLVAVGADFPPDLAGEITRLMERAIELMKSRGGPPPEPRDGGERPGDERPPTPPGGDAPPPGPPAPGPDEDDTPEDGPDGHGDGDGAGDGPGARADAEAQARRAWTEAHVALAAGRYGAAHAAYTLLLQRHGATALVEANGQAIRGGLHAARVGVEGPAALFAVPVEEKRGELSVTYTFDDLRIVDRDFSIERPFPSDQPLDGEVRGGDVHLGGATALLHDVVWAPHVRLEVEATVTIPHDIGAIALGEDRRLRAVVFTAANTRFQLKKGAAARPEPGHLLWFLGPGAWADADADAIGYVKIAERREVGLEAGDRIRLDLQRDGTTCEASFQGASDGVSLRGTVRGDDGSGLGPARVGVFTNTGGLVVHVLRIRGKVDTAWFASHLADLVSQDPGPP